ncbi:hypothetical protein F2P81_013255 [Scophthalmus maximus]|uniref:Uncharacterized protein n=1 Tax=Scophthalmus maximus TaxID=52904 RepID=A0A6A4SQ95_SCOMX|nr:hypothetical protein F2P81_013255 [Scophthalmus maximus]
MESRREQLTGLRRQRAKEGEAARRRNAALLQTKYWVSVEESIPAWEHFLVGKGPHPTDGAGPTAMRAKQTASTAEDRGLPPRPKPRAARAERPLTAAMAGGAVPGFPLTLCQPRGLGLSSCCLTLKRGGFMSYTKRMQHWP